MKKVTLLLLALLLTLSFGILVSADEATDDVTITIFHTNDMHGRLHDGSNDDTIGLDYIASIVASTENAIIVDAGDTIHGIPFVNFSGGENAVTLMSAAGYSFMAPGNHDFNFGVERLIELNELADFTVLAANVFWNDTDELVFDAYATMEVAGITLGFFGLATPETPIVTHPANVADIYFGDITEAANAAVAALLDLDVDVIIAITHLGFVGTYNTQDLAAAVPEIDLIIDGHSHTTLPEGYWVGDVLIVQAYEHGKSLGRVDITVGAELTMVASLIDQEYAQENFERAPEVVALIEEMIAEIEAFSTVVVAYTPVLLEGDRRYIRTQELPLGNLVADAFTWSSGADFAIMNSGAIRDTIEAGDITFGDVSRVLPFINYLEVIEITPAVLFAALENGVSLWPVDNGRFPQVSGFAFSFDGFAEPGSRVLEVTVNGVALDRNDTTTVYTLAITDFKASGGDGYDMFIDLVRVGQDGLMSDLFTAYITSDAVDLTALEIEGRMVQVGEAPEVVEEEYAEVVTLPAPAPEVVVPAGYATVVNADLLHVRANAGASANVVGTVARGDVVVILDSVTLTGGHVWYQIQLGDLVGWSFGRFLELA